MAIFAALEDNQKTKAELEELKHQLFRENVRIQAERVQLEKDYDDLHRERKEIMNEHIRHCISHAIEDGDTEAVEEFQKAIEKFF